jgi:hypothetical protein
LAPQPFLCFELAGMAAGRIGGGVLIERPLLAIGVDPGRTHVHEAVLRLTGPLHHGAAVGERTPTAVDDDVEGPALQRGEGLGVGAVTDQVLHPGRHGVAAAGEQAELVAEGLQLGHQGLADEAGATHHQNLHPIHTRNAPTEWQGSTEPAARFSWPRRPYLGRSRRA